MTINSRVTQAPPAIELRRAFSTFPTGVVAVGALVDDKPVGMVVNSFTSISLDPPLVAISPARTSSTWPILAGRRLGMSVLAVEHEALCRQLSARVGDRFEGTEWESTPDGAVLIKGAALWLECNVRSAFDGGDHEIVVLEVLEARTFPDVDPIVFHKSRFAAINETR